MTFQSPGRLTSWQSALAGFVARFDQALISVTIPTPGIARVRVAPGEQFREPRSWAPVPADPTLEPVSVDLTEDGDSLSASGGDIEVTLDRDGRCRFRRSKGDWFAADREPPRWTMADLARTALRPAERASYPTGAARLMVETSKALASDCALYGFGQRTGMLDRRGRRLPNWTIDPDHGHGRAHANLYQAWPCFMAHRPGHTWGALLNSSWYSEFDAGASDWGTLTTRTLGGELDYFVLVGPTPADVVEQLTRITGRPFLPPLWALGYHQSRWGYDSETRMREVAAEFAAREIPIGALHFDIDYMRGYRGFTWDPDRFPEPDRLIAELEAQGIMSVTIVDPGVKFDLSPEYYAAREGLVEGYFVQKPDGTPFSGYCWPDAALFPDFAREATRDWWGRLHAAYTDVGVAGIWCDMNEPAIFDAPFSSGFSVQKPMDLDARHGGREAPATHAEVHNLYGHLMQRATYEGLRALRPDRRPWTLSRSAGPGSQRYGAQWMGDNSSWWEHLELSLPQLMSMGLCGAPHVGVDVGGFLDNPSPELFARWIMVGALYPFMRTHSASDTADQEPWSFGPEVEQIARDAIRLRYQLLPYLYTLAVEAHLSGAPLLRPLLFDFPSDSATRHLEDQLMLGPALMAAPILRPGATHRLVYLPAGCWYSFVSGRPVDGGAHRVVEAPLGVLPLWGRAGHVVPLGNVRSSTREPLEQLELNVFPGDGAGRWVEDDGISMAYRDGVIAERRWSMSSTGSRLRFDLDATTGSYEPAPRELALRLVTGQRPARVLRDGEEVEWAWDEAGGSTRIAWPDDHVAHTVVIEGG